MEDKILEVAVVCDDYKFGYWMQELNKSKWRITHIGPGVTSNTRLIKLAIPQPELSDVKAYLKKMDLDFKRSN